MTQPRVRTRRLKRRRRGSGSGISRQSRPSHRRQRHGIAADRTERKQQYRKPFIPCGMPGRTADARFRCRRSPSSMSGRRPNLSTSLHRDYGADEIDCPRDHDVEQDVVHPVTGFAIDLLGIVEDHIDAAPLLEYRQGNPMPRTFRLESESKSPNRARPRVRRHRLASYPSSAVRRNVSADAYQRARAVPLAAS